MRTVMDRDFSRPGFGCSDSYAFFHGGLTGTALVIPAAVYRFPQPWAMTVMIGYLMFMWGMAVFFECWGGSFFSVAEYGRLHVIPGILLLAFIPAGIRLIGPFPRDADWADAVYWAIWGGCALLYQTLDILDHIMGWVTPWYY